MEAVIHVLSALEIPLIQDIPLPVRVLLVEDEDVDAMLIERLIRNPSREGTFEVVRVSSLAEATQLMVVDQFHVALLDLGLPDGNGMESLHILRSVDACLPIVILTGHQDEMLGLQAVMSGAQDFLCKSAISGQALFRVLRYAIARHLKMMGFAAEAHTDFLTGLPNRRQFDQTFEALAQANDQLCFAMIDVDHFKNINDTYGHAYGDHVLQGLADLFGRELDCKTHIARIGGEEFAILLPGFCLREAHQCLEHLRKSIENQAWKHGETDVDVTVSIGLVEVADATEKQVATELADRALYAAKNNGRNQVMRSSEAVNA